MMPIRIAMRAGLLLSGLVLTACVARAPAPTPSPGVVVPAPASSPGGVVPGAPITPGLPTGEPAPLPDTRPPLSPNLPKSIEDSRAAIPVISLVKAANASLANGRTDQAGASLERAMRIEPRNPWVWQALAKLQVHVHTFSCKKYYNCQCRSRKTVALGVGKGEGDPVRLSSSGR